MTAPMFIDLFLIIIFVACVWMAARKGIWGALSGIAGSLAGLIGAWILTPKLTFLTIKGITPFLGGMVRRAAESVGLDGLLESPIVTETRQGLMDLLAALGVPSDAWEVLAAGGESAGEHISAVAGQALAEQIAPVITFIVLFLLIQLAVRLVCSLLSLDLPILRSVNRLGGMLLGVVTGLCMVVALCWGVMRFAPGEDVGLISRPAMTQSRVGGAVVGFFGFE